MPVHHIAIWSPDMERLRTFYEKYFDACSGKKYVNPSGTFSSYMLNFGDDNCRIELMQIPGLQKKTHETPVTGYAHIALSMGSRDKVNHITEQLRSDNYNIKSEPRTTGDGYYESVILDPDGNYIEITI